MKTTTKWKFVGSAIFGLIAGLSTMFMCKNAYTAGEIDGVVGFKQAFEGYDPEGWEGFKEGVHVPEHLKEYLR